jgi:hypothetical protein
LLDYITGVDERSFYGKRVESKKPGGGVIIVKTIKLAIVVTYSTPTVISEVMNRIYISV